MPPDTYKSAQTFSGSRDPGYKCAKYKLYLNKMKKSPNQKVTIRLQAALSARSQ